VLHTNILEVEMTADQESALQVLAGGLATGPGTTVRPDEVRLRQLRSLFQIFLPDGSENEFTQLAIIQQELHLQQVRLQAMLSDGILNPEEYADGLNKELSWCVRRCASVLGDGRTKQIFSLESLENIVLVEPQLIASNRSAMDVSSDFRQLTRVWIGRYVPVKKERRLILKAVRGIDPQRAKRVSTEQWDLNSPYAHLVQSIATAEETYRIGAVESSIQHAHLVVGAVSNLDVVSDVPMYLAAWAHHIQGRGYEAQSNWQQAALHYECSLVTKFALQEWLPELPLIATEIKLGLVELFQSPAEAAVRLLRVSDSLAAHSRRPNSRLFRNLLEDSWVGLAEAYLATGYQNLAVRQANSALPLARRLRDRVGEIRILYLLYRASALSLVDATKKIQDILHHDPRFARHPRVALVLQNLEIDFAEEWAVG
jgi:hypothetical protein